MKILFLLNHFLPAQVAGTEVYTWALAKSLQQKGHDVSIIIPNYDSDSDDEYVHDGLQVSRYAEPNTIDRKLISGKRPPDGIEAFELLVKKENPDLVNIMELNPSSGIGLYHLEILHALKIPIVVTLHLASYSCYTGTLMFKNVEPCDGVIRIGKCTRCALSRFPINSFTQELLYVSSMPLLGLNINTSNLNAKAGTAFSYPFVIENLRTRLHLIANYSSRIIVLADWFKKVLLANEVPEEKIVMISQGLPYGVTQVPVQISKDYSGPLRLMYMGRIYPAKGLQILLEATESLQEDDFNIDIYGANNYTVFLEQLKEKTLQKTNVHWKGTLAQKDVVSTIRLYDAVVVPSIVCEMAPLLIQEAFAAGVPVVGSNVQGISEQIQDEHNGLLFKMGSATELKTLLQNLVTDRSILKRLSANIQLPKSFDKVSRETLSLYESVLDAYTLLN